MAETRAREEEPSEQAGAHLEMRQRLSRLQRLLSAFALAFVLGYGVTGAVLRSRILVELGGIALSFVLINWVARALIRRHHLDAGVYAISGGLIVLTVCSTMLLPALYPMTALGSVLAGTIGLLYLKGASLRRLLVPCWLALLLTVLLGQLMPPRTAVPSSFLVSINLFGAAVGGGLVLTLLMQYSTRLNESLLASQTQEQLVAVAQSDSAAQHERLATTLAAISEGVITLDAKGRVEYMNDAARRLLGIAAPAPATPLWIVFRPIRQDSREPLSRELEAALSSGRPFSLEDVILPLRDGSERRISFGIAPLLGTGQRGSVIVFRDVTELRRLDELRIAKDAAEATAQTKARFLASMSHEIRTPMNAVIGMTSLLTSTELSAKQQELVEVIRTSAEHLLALINDILDFSKIEADKIELESHPFRLQECIESSLDLVSGKAEEKSLELVYLVEPEVPLGFHGDLGRLRQILVNLLGNAVKFTSRGEVALTVTSRRLPQHRHELLFKVRDTGPGIAPEQRSQLFQAFSQLGNPITSNLGGTGLGLAISKHLVELMGGTISVESEVGKGSTFAFSVVLEEAPLSASFALRELIGFRGHRMLVVDDNEINRRLLGHLLDSWDVEAVLCPSPREALEQLRHGERFSVAILDYQMPEMDGLQLAAEIRKLRPPAQLKLLLLGSWLAPEAAAAGFAARLLKPIKPAQLYDVLHDLLKDSPGAKEARAQARAAAGLIRAREPLRILVAEDNPINQRVAAAMLEQLGHRPDFAGNGREALEAVKRQRYDAVLMDVQMPEMDGLAATREICSRFTRESRPRIIGLTAHALVEYQRQCLQAGMDEYLTKPVTLEKLSEALTRCVPAASTRSGTIPPSTLSRERAVLNLDALEALRRAGGSELLRDVVKLFLKDTPTVIKAFERALRGGQGADARRCIHSLKSSAAYVGAEELAGLCAEAERALAEERGADAEQLLPRIAAAFSAVQPPLDQSLHELAKAEPEAAHSGPHAN